MAGLLGQLSNLKLLTLSLHRVQTQPYHPTNLNPSNLPARSLNNPAAELSTQFHDRGTVPGPRSSAQRMRLGLFASAEDQSDDEAALPVTVELHA
jgi:hypothetical protein